MPDKPKPKTLKDTATLATAKKRATFLRSLARYGNVTKAAAAARATRQTAYKWRDADATFAEKWDSIMEGLIDAAEAELYRRGVIGVVKPVFQGGEKVGQVREFSDTALIFLLKCNREKYRPVQRIAPTDPTGENPLTLRVVYDEDGN